MFHSFVFLVCFNSNALFSPFGECFSNVIAYHMLMLTKFLARAVLSTLNLHKFSEID